MPYATAWQRRTFYLPNIAFSHAKTFHEIRIASLRNPTNVKPEKNSDIWKQRHRRRSRALDIESERKFRWHDGNWRRKERTRKQIIQVQSNFTRNEWIKLHIFGSVWLPVRFDVTLSRKFFRSCSIMLYLHQFGLCITLNRDFEFSFVVSFVMQWTASKTLLLSSFDVYGAGHENHELDTSRSHRFQAFFVSHKRNLWLRSCVAIVNRWASVDSSSRLPIKYSFSSRWGDWRRFYAACEKVQRSGSRAGFECFL